MADASADRTVTFPDSDLDLSTVVTTSSSGTVTSAMISNGAIVGEDLSSSISISTSGSFTAASAVAIGQYSSSISYSGVTVKGFLDVESCGEDIKLGCDVQIGAESSDEIEFKGTVVGATPLSFNGGDGNGDVSSRRASGARSGDVRWVFSPGFGGSRDSSLCGNGSW